MLTNPCIISGQTELVIVNNFRPTVLGQQFINQTQDRSRFTKSTSFPFPYIYIIYTYTQRIPRAARWRYLATMPASFMTLPFELREQILIPIVRTRATIELQYPLWADTDKSVFAPPVAQVCRELREEVFQCFYRTNVFVWKIDSEPVRDSREWVARVRG